MEHGSNVIAFTPLYASALITEALDRTGLTLENNRFKKISEEVLPAIDFALLFKKIGLGEHLIISRENPDIAYIQGYNAQAAVDGTAQIIVAHAMTPSMSDQGQFVPLIAGIEKNLGRKPKEVSADAGYCSEANLEASTERGIAAYVATGRAKHPAAAKREPSGPLTQAMRQKLRRAGYRSRYRLRKQIVEPVFGQIKQARGFRQFLLRGIEKVRAEWAMICTAHNLTKLAKAA